MEFGRWVVVELERNDDKTRVKVNGLLDDKNSRQTDRFFVNLPQMNRPSEVN